MSRASLISEFPSGTGDITAANLRDLVNATPINTGAWSAATAYTVNDLVSAGGSTFICIQAHSNQQPPDATFWQAIGEAPPVTSVAGRAGAITLTTADVSGLGSAAVMNTWADVIVIAGSNATPAQLVQAAVSGGIVCTGSTSSYIDDQSINAVLSAVPGNCRVALYGSFYISETVLIRQNGTVLDLYNASIYVSPTFAAGAAAAVMIGTQHGLSCTCSLVDGIATFATSNGTPYQDGDGVYITPSVGGTLPTGYSAATQYYFYNVTPTGYSNGTFQLTTTPGVAPPTSASAGSGPIYVGDLIATYNSTSQTLTISGTSPPVLAAGTLVYFFTNPSIPTGFTGESPYFLAPTGWGGNTYFVYADPRCTVQATASSDGYANGFVVLLPTQNCAVAGGSFYIPATAAGEAVRTGVANLHAHYLTTASITTSRPRAPGCALFSSAARTRRSSATRFMAAPWASGLIWGPTRRLAEILSSGPKPES